MKAKLTKIELSNGRNLGRDKELVSAYSVIGRINGELREVVCARAYMGRSARSSVVYASIWVHAPIICISGHGSAGGYGYHKESTAFAEAIESAGIELWGDQYADESGMVYKDFPNPEWSEEKRAVAYAESNDAGRRFDWRTPRTLRRKVKEDLKNRARIGGCGDSSMRCAFLAIARAAGARGKLLIVSH
jgi:hypothetical protein